MTRVLVLVGLLTVGAVSAAEAQIFSWRDAEGMLVLSDEASAPGDLVVTVLDDAPMRTPNHGPALRSFDQLIDHYASRARIRPGLVRAIIQVESGFDPTATSSAGAMGLMQLMPETARELGVADPYDPEENIRGGTTYFRQLLDRYSGDERLALAAYNAGPGSVARYGNQIPPFAETRHYVDTVGSTTTLRAPASIRRHGSTTIYRTDEVIDGRRVMRYSDVPPPTRRDTPSAP